MGGVVPTAASLWRVGLIFLLCCLLPSAGYPAEGEASKRCVSFRQKPNVAIPDLSSQTFSFTLPRMVFSGELQLTLGIEHTAMKDIEVDLKHTDSSGTKRLVKILEGQGGNHHDALGTKFTDFATRSILDPSLPFGEGPYRPVGTPGSGPAPQLQTLVGDDGTSHYHGSLVGDQNGVQADTLWELSVRDTLGTDTGHMHYWTLSFCERTDSDFLCLPENRALPPVGGSEPISTGFASYDNARVSFPTANPGGLEMWWDRRWNPTKIALKVEHTRVNDLRLQINAPTLGTYTDVFTHVGGLTADIDWIEIIDRAMDSNPIDSATGPLVLEDSPFGPDVAFDSDMSRPGSDESNPLDVSSGQVWQLRFYDAHNSHSGTLKGFAIGFFQGACGPVIEGETLQIARTNIYPELHPLPVGTGIYHLPRVFWSIPRSEIILNDFIGSVAPVSAPRYTAAGTAGHFCYNQGMDAHDTLPVPIDACTPTGCKDSTLYDPLNRPRLGYKWQLFIKARACCPTISATCNYRIGPQSDLSFKLYPRPCTTCEFKWIKPGTDHHVYKCVGYHGVTFYRTVSKNTTDPQTLFLSPSRDCPVGSTPDSD